MQRGIIEGHFALAMAYGAKYIDRNTGAKILYHSHSRTTLVLDRDGEIVVTAYKQSIPKRAWIRTQW